MAYNRNPNEVIKSLEYRNLGQITTEAITAWECPDCSAVVLVRATHSAYHYMIQRRIDSAGLRSNNY